MESLKKILDIRKASFILIALPYLIFHWDSIYYSPFFTYGNLGLLIASLIAIELVIKWVISINIKIEGTISMFIVFISLLFFYGEVVAINFQRFFNDQLGILIRGRTIVFFCVLMCLLLVFKIKKGKSSYRIFNVFLLIFSGITLFSQSNKTSQANDINGVNNNFKQIRLANKNAKPVVLIISDEYSSPDALYQINKNSNTYNFSKNLAKQGWLVRNSSYSYEQSTIHSLSSLFNFNLSSDGDYSKQNNPNVGIYKLLHAAMADSLETKNVSIINYGVFNIGKSEPLSQLYLYPKNFLESVLMFTSYYSVKYHTGGLKLSGLAGSYYPTENHNKYILRTLNDTLRTISNPKKFIYAHLFMPHVPMVFNPEFPFRKTDDNLKGYEDFWRFTNQKLETLLKDLCKENKYRIILTGDHGFRKDPRIDPHYTFSAYYGFDQSAIDQVKSVQDLGSLINASF